MILWVGNIGIVNFLFRQLSIRWDLIFVGLRWRSCSEVGRSLELIGFPCFRDFLTSGVQLFRGREDIRASLASQTFLLRELLTAKWIDNKMELIYSRFYVLLSITHLFVVHVINMNSTPVLNLVADKSFSSQSGRTFGSRMLSLCRDSQRSHWVSEWMSDGRF